MKGFNRLVAVIGVVLMLGACSFFQKQGPPDPGSQQDIAERVVYAVAAAGCAALMNKVLSPSEVEDAKNVLTEMEPQLQGETIDIPALQASLEKLPHQMGSYLTPALLVFQPEVSNAIDPSVPAFRIFFKTQNGCRVGLGMPPVVRSDGLVGTDGIPRLAT